MIQFIVKVSISAKIINPFTGNERLIFALIILEEEKYDCADFYPRQLALYRHYPFG